jgi:hypothetical protein
MEILWLLLGIALLGLLWGAIKGTEWLSQYVKARHDLTNAEKERLEKEERKAASDFKKANIRWDVVENFVWPDDLPDNLEDAPADFREAFNSLTGDELTEILLRHKFGNGQQEENAKLITAQRSAFVEKGMQVAATGKGIKPMIGKVIGRKPKSSLSKKEQKLLNQIKDEEE